MCCIDWFLGLANTVYILNNHLVPYVAKDNLYYHCYADDRHVYADVIPNITWVDTSSQLEACLADTFVWMSANMLDWIKKRQNGLSHAETSLKGNWQNPTSSSMKTLAMWFDIPLTTEKQVNTISCTCYYHIQNIDGIRQYYMTDACRTLVHAFVTS